MTSGKVYVIGAGLAGLAAAVRLAGRGRAVTVIEAAAQAGGRCRSYLDPALGMTIDNGNHLLLSGNRAAFDYLAEIGAADRVAGPEEAVFDFFDLRDGRRWTLRPNTGALAWWIFDPARRVPGTRALDYLAFARLIGPQGARRVDQAISCEGTLWDRLIDPFLLAALNTDPPGASAALAAAVVRETLALGGHACRPRIAHPSLDAAFIAPALAFLEQRGAQVRLGQRVQALDFEAGRVAAIRLGSQTLRLLPDDQVVLATPPWVTRDLAAGVETPDAFKAIVNGHFRIQAPAGAPAMVGVIGGAAQWLFAFEGRISVTVSGADDLVDQDREALAARLWRDVARVYGLDGPLPAWQIVKEKRATFAATPEQAAKRPGARTGWPNLVLAGDWTDTGLPATIEGAIRSGHKAAALVLEGR
ncbi:MAG: FAD-dependent oxidoreductase [Caulobacteraceae bacterium]|nr:FAD-dependent oxidoreductase [Caulobacteraceae bacterium]